MTKSDKHKQIYAFIHPIKIKSPEQLKACGIYDNDIAITRKLINVHEILITCNGL